MKKNDLQDQIRRIEHYEGILREAEGILRPGTVPEDRRKLLCSLVRELDGYYGSDVWKRDLADDEAGLLPRDLRRGVLSEDGVFNVLEEYGELEQARILEELRRMQDKEYAAFQAKLLDVWLLKTANLEAVPDALFDPAPYQDTADAAALVQAALNG